MKAFSLVFVLLMITFVHSCDEIAEALSTISSCVDYGAGYKCELDLLITFALPMVAGSCASFNMTSIRDSSGNILYPAEPLSFVLSVVEATLHVPLARPYYAPDTADYDDRHCSCVDGNGHCEKTHNPGYYCEGVADYGVGYWLPECGEGCGHECPLGRINCGCMYSTAGEIEALVSVLDIPVPQYNLVVTMVNGPNNFTRSLIFDDSIVSIPFSLNGFDITLTQVSVIQTPTGLEDRGSIAVWQGTPYIVNGFNDLGEQSMSNYGWMRRLPTEPYGKYTVSVNYNLANVIDKNQDIGCCFEFPPGPISGVDYNVDNCMIRNNPRFVPVLIYQNLLTTILSPDYAYRSINGSESFYIILSIVRPMAGTYTLQSNAASVVFITSEASATITGITSSGICEDLSKEITVKGNNQGPDGLVYAYITSVNGSTTDVLIGSFNALANQSFVTTLSYQSEPDAHVELCLRSHIESCAVFIAKCTHEIDPNPPPPSEQHGTSDSGGGKTRLKLWEIILIVFVCLLAVCLFLCFCMICLGWSRQISDISGLNRRS